MYVLSRNVKNVRVFLSENFQFMEMKFSIYLNRRVFVMQTALFHMKSLNKSDSPMFVKCPVAAVNGLPVHELHRTSNYIFISYGIIEPILVTVKSNTA